jgi:hypothetical protein
MRYAGRVESMREIKNQYKVLAGKSEKKWPIVGTMITRRDNIKTGAIRCEVLEWLSMG